MSQHPELRATGVLGAEELRLLDAYWRAANYLSVGQIYLLDNPLLREPLRPEHIKPRLLGHWGTTPGLNLLYAHLNRCIRQRDLDVLCRAWAKAGGGARLVVGGIEAERGRAWLERRGVLEPAGEIFQKPLSITGELEILGLDAALSPQPPSGGAGSPSEIRPASK